MTIPMHEQNAALVARSNNYRFLSFAVALLLFLPIGIFCGIAGARMSRQATDAALAGDDRTAERLLAKTRLVSIAAVVPVALAIVAWVVWVLTIIFGGR